MIEIINKFLKEITEMYDLGSMYNIDVFIYKDKAYYTTVNEGDDIITCDITELGNKISTDIMLQGLSTPNFYGSWTEEKSLNTLEEISKWKANDIEFDLELAKFWEMTRMICNSKRGDNAYHIGYWKEARCTFFDIYKNEEELEKYFKITFEE